jgi:hypothetical protein
MDRIGFNFFKECPIKRTRNNKNRHIHAFGAALKILVCALSGYTQNIATRTTARQGYSRALDNAFDVTLCIADSLHGYSVPDVFLCNFFSRYFFSQMTCCRHMPKTYLSQ